jgi:hypothetical protein
MGLELLHKLETQLEDDELDVIPKFLSQLEDSTTVDEYNNILETISNLSFQATLDRLPYNEYIKNERPKMYKGYEDMKDMVTSLVNARLPPGILKLTKQTLENKVLDTITKKNIPLLIELDTSPDSLNEFYSSYKNLEGEIQKVYPGYTIEIPEPKDKKFEEFKTRREDLSKRIDTAAQEEKDPEIHDALMEIAEDLLNDSTTEKDYEKDLARFRELIGPKEKTKGVSGSKTGSGKKMLCRFSSGLGIY